MRIFIIFLLIFPLPPVIMEIGLNIARSPPFLIRPTLTFYLFMIVPAIASYAINRMFDRMAWTLLAGAIFVPGFITVATYTLATPRLSLILYFALSGAVAAWASRAVAKRLTLGVKAQD